MAAPSPFPCHAFQGMKQVGRSPSDPARRCLKPHRFRFCQSNARFQKVKVTAVRRAARFRRRRAWASRDSSSRCSSRCSGRSASQRSGSKASKAAVSPGAMAGSVMAGRVGPDAGRRRIQARITKPPNDGKRRETHSRLCPPVVRKCPQDRVKHGVEVLADVLREEAKHEIAVFL